MSTDTELDRLNAGGSAPGTSRRTHVPFAHLFPGAQAKPSTDLPGTAPAAPKSRRQRKVKQKREDRAGSHVASPRSAKRRQRRTWRQRIYRAARGRTVQRAFAAMEWDHVTQSPTMLSSHQVPALMPTLVDTRPRQYGYQAGIDQMTGRLVEESVFGLYRAGIITSPNKAIVGDVGTGKSTKGKIEGMRCMVTEGAILAVYDRKRQRRADGSIGGEYDLLAEAVGGTRFVFNQDRRRGCRINLLDPAFSPDSADEDAPVGQDRLLVTAAEHALDRSLTETESRSLTLAHRRALEVSRDEGRVPELADVVRALQEPGDDPLLSHVETDELRRWGLPVAVALARYLDGDLAGLIDGQTSGPNGEPIDFNAPLLVMDTSALAFGSPQLGIIMAVTTAYLMSSWIQTPGRPKVILLEEGYSADGLGVVPSLFRDIAKRSRGVGASVWAFFHHISDLAPESPLRSLITESEVIDVFRQDKPADAEQLVELMGLEPRLAETLMLLPKGTHLRRRGSGKTLPTTFIELILSPREAQISYTDEAMVSS